MADKFRRLLDKTAPGGGVKCHCCKTFKRKERKKLNRIVRSRIKDSDLKRGYNV